MPELCEVQPGCCEDNARMPDCVIAVRVTRVEWRAGRCARLGPRKEPDGNRIGIILRPRQDAVDKGSHSRDRSVLPRRIVDVVPPECKVSRKQGDALRLASSVHTSHNQLGLASKEGEEDTRGHGDDV